MTCRGREVHINAQHVTLMQPAAAPSRRRRSTTIAPFDALGLDCAFDRIVVTFLFEGQSSSPDSEFGDVALFSVMNSRFLSSRAVTAATDILYR